jgi:hypothetical protein
VSPEDLGSFEREAELEARGRRFWARILACGVVFGGLFVLSGVIVGAIYLLVWACRRG